MIDKLILRHPRRARSSLSAPFSEVLTNACAAQIGAMTERGYSPYFMSDQLNNTVSPSTIRRMQDEWYLQRDGKKGTKYGMKLRFNERERSNLEARARQNGLGVEEYCRRILIRSSMPKDLYEAIVTDPEAFE